MPDMREMMTAFTSMDVADCIKEIGVTSFMKSLAQDDYARIRDYIIEQELRPSREPCALLKNAG